MSKANGVQNVCFFWVRRDMHSYRFDFERADNMTIAPLNSS